MYRLILFLGICSAFALGSEQKKNSKHSEEVVGCYHVMNVPYQDPQPVLVKTGIGASLCNYLVYGFLAVGPNGSVVYDNPVPDKASGKLQYFDAHWKNSLQIKTLAHLQAWNDQYSSNMKNVLYDPHMRETIVKNVVNFVKKFVFNGIDLDFAYMSPVNGDTKADRQNLVLLLKAFKDEFKKAGLILSVSVDPRTRRADILYDIKGISDYADFINLKPFYSQEPLYKKKDGTVDHTSPVSHSPYETYYIDDFVKHWKDNGVPANKLILGITLNGPPLFDFDAPFTGEAAYSYPADPSTCNSLKEFQIDPLKEKAGYVKKMKLGGIVVQNLVQDDVLGKCGEKFAVLKSLNQILRNKS